MKIKDIYKLYTHSYSVSTDTRKIEKGCLFFALKGTNFNGNAFAEDALRKGATYAIIDEIEYKKNDSFILVENVLATLQELASFHRRQLAIPIISLTGSNGKTTTKELINAVLSRKYRTIATVGNLNNHIGVPLTLLSLSSDTEIGIIEMGANHLEEIKFLCGIAEPDFGYITNFGKAHLEGFGGFEGVIKGKSEMYDYLRENHKKAFINANDAKQLEMSFDIERFSFSEIIGDVVIKQIEANPFVTVQYRNMIINSQLIGAYNFNNIAAAISIGNYFKVEDRLIVEAIESYTPANNRSQIINKGTNKIILDAYNANPSSMQVALENLSSLTDTLKIAILGDMFELGDASVEEHQKVADLAASLKIDALFFVGENFNKVINKKAQLFKSFDDFKDSHSLRKLDNSTILIKGSRGMALERTLDLL